MLNEKECEHNIDYIQKHRDKIYRFREDIEDLVVYMTIKKLNNQYGVLSKSECINNLFGKSEDTDMENDEYKSYLEFFNDYHKKYSEEMMNFLLPPKEIIKQNYEEEIDDDNAKFFAKKLMESVRDISIYNALTFRDKHTKAIFNKNIIKEIIIETVDITIANFLFCLEELHNFNEAELNICHYDKKTDIIYYHEGIYSDYCYYSGTDDDEDWIFKYSEFPKIIED